ncbi:hypothetical protein B0T17DRAFT_524227 [Bombardia bombarda]|uniref:Uncharacterized protein n=1 Tax=Bombardia bombarda TaxID=252184 RepID=A0AA39X8A9_9PEZI|nr:hypothetical protein B0T17DRAFT_524227 [Bombardia bombarda]
MSGDDSYEKFAQDVQLHAIPEEGFANRRLDRDSVLRQAQAMGIRFEALPQMPWFAGLFGFSDAWNKEQITARCLGYTYLANRMLDQTEIDAAAYHVANRNRTMAYSDPLTAGIAIYYERRGRASFKFPFYTPKAATFNPERFPIGPSAWRTGPAARAAWHGTRAAAYATVIYIGVHTVMRVWGDFTMFTSMAQDKRLAKWREAVKHNPNLPQNQHQPAGRPQPTRRSRSQPQPYQQQQDQQEQQQYGQQYEQQEEQSSPPQRTRTWRPQPTPAPSPPSPSEVVAPQDDDSFLFDDASPVAPAVARQTGESSTSGSVWDRIRQGSRAGANAGSTTQGDKTTTTAPRGWAARRQQAAQEAQQTDDYVYSREAQDKATAKDQAQREFDAMLERERRGSN